MVMTKNGPRGVQCVGYFPFFGMLSIICLLVNYGLFTNCTYLNTKKEKVLLQSVQDSIVIVPPPLGFSIHCTYFYLLRSFKFSR